ncbi:hypothetical protein O181_020023 [Austropuccinia psidii MF-1]|uniref:Uncharacterized protein n=1 Tax=Austropuccinia psidii MF-1 TaxID=1389203 RepID=A0A9Q3GU52_9BASI|nr:hypothetical protein [Austropuccinia psidii MF-1]
MMSATDCSGLQQLISRTDISFGSKASLSMIFGSSSIESCQWVASVPTPSEPLHSSYGAPSGGTQASERQSQKSRWDKGRDSQYFKDQDQREAGFDDQNNPYSIRSSSTQGYHNREWDRGMASSSANKHYAHGYAPSGQTSSPPYYPPYGQQNPQPYYPPYGQHNPQPYYPPYGQHNPQPYYPPYGQQNTQPYYPPYSQQNPQPYYPHNQYSPSDYPSYSTSPYGYSQSHHSSSSYPYPSSNNHPGPEAAPSGHPATASNSYNPASGSQ